MNLTRPTLGRGGCASSLVFLLVGQGAFFVCDGRRQLGFCDFRVGLKVLLLWWA